MANNTCITCGMKIPQGAFYCSLHQPRNVEFEQMHPAMAAKSAIAPLFDPTARITPCFSHIGAAEKIT